jgi:hypothetical protein
MEARVYYPSYSGGKDWENHGWASQLLSSINKRIEVQACLGINVRPYLKNN